MMRSAWFWWALATVVCGAALFWSVRAFLSLSTPMPAPISTAQRLDKALGSAVTGAADAATQLRQVPVIGAVARAAASATDDPRCKHMRGADYWEAAVALDESVSHEITCGYTQRDCAEECSIHGASSCQWIDEDSGGLRAEGCRYRCECLFDAATAERADRRVEFCDSRGGGTFADGEVHSLKECAKACAPCMVRDFDASHASCSCAGSTYRITDPIVPLSEINDTVPVPGSKHRIGREIGCDLHLTPCVLGFRCEAELRLWTDAFNDKLELGRALAVADAALHERRKADRASHSDTCVAHTPATATREDVEAMLRAKAGAP